jgi:hypothetical protein
MCTRIMPNIINGEAPVKLSHTSFDPAIATIGKLAAPVRITTHTRILQNGARFN